MAIEQVALIDQYKAERRRKLWILRLPAAFISQRPCDSGRANWSGVGDHMQVTQIYWLNVVLLEDRLIPNTRATNTEMENGIKIVVVLNNRVWDPKLRHQAFYQRSAVVSSIGVDGPPRCRDVPSEFPDLVIFKRIDPDVRSNLDCESAHDRGVYAKKLDNRVYEFVAFCWVNCRVERDYHGWAVTYSYPYARLAEWQRLHERLERFLDLHTVHLDKWGELEGVRSGSSVIEVTREALVLGRSKFVTRGEAPFVDLGSNRHVIAIMDHGPNGENVSQMTSLPIEAYRYYKWDEAAWTHRAKMNGRVELKPPLIPTLVNSVLSIGSAAAQRARPRDFVIDPQTFLTSCPPGHRIQFQAEGMSLYVDPHWLETYSLLQLADHYRNSCPTESVQVRQGLVNPLFFNRSIIAAAGIEPASLGSSYFQLLIAFIPRRKDKPLAQASSDPVTRPLVSDLPPSFADKNSQAQQRLYDLRYPIDGSDF